MRVKRGKSLKSNGLETIIYRGQLGVAEKQKEASARGLRRNSK